MSERGLSTNREEMVRRAGEHAGLRDQQIVDFMAYYLQVSINCGERFDEIVNMAIDWLREEED